MELAEALAEALKPKAKENQKQHGGTAPGKSKNTSVNIDGSVDCREQACKEASVSLGSMSAYKFAKANATAEELAELKRDPNKKLHRVVKDVKERKARCSRQSKRHEAAKGTGLDERIIVGDFRKHAS